MKRETIYETIRGFVGKAPLYSGAFASALGIGSTVAIALVGMPWTLVGFGALFAAAGLAAITVDAIQESMKSPSPAKGSQAAFLKYMKKEVGGFGPIFSIGKIGLLGICFTAPAVLMLGKLMSLMPGGMGGMGSLIAFGASAAIVITAGIAIFTIGGVHAKHPHWKASLTETTTQPQLAPVMAKPRPAEALKDTQSKGQDANPDAGARASGGDAAAGAAATGARGEPAPARHAPA